MKFSHDTDGKLVPTEVLALQACVADLEQQLDDRPLATRAGDIAHLKSALSLQSGPGLTDEDNRVLALYQEGVLDFRHVFDHFEQRLVAVMAGVHGE
ncbi:hypothetical protein PMI14_02112 [Acidovorax sp. CF316]|uniref:hypothetical protein n=1 Tax=Acidovorax sp. CF316 TaxID=1144317 RepID=UPI00026BE1BC|nr:hypothetical protein [Acidovorax sp. CF316]EJE53213.1 hypothetical protein PMI14_02112 [Acidovorax sp. CF316]